MFLNVNMEVQITKTQLGDFTEISLSITGVVIEIT